MSKFKRTTSATVSSHITILSDFVDGLDKDRKRVWAEWFNEQMDSLLAEDAFGTDGQCDPRGDHRG